MIHTIGDSHAVASFAGITGVVTHTVGPVTMARVGHLDDDLLPLAVGQLGLNAADVLIVCCGEIDVRCHLKPRLDRRGAVLVDLAAGLVGRYLTRVVTLPVNGARRAVLSVTPPAPAVRAQNLAFPPAGTDAERVTYTQAVNTALRAGCAVVRVTLIDVAAAYADADGMLIATLSDGGVHIKDTAAVRAALAGVL